MAQEEKLWGADGGVGETEKSLSSLDMNDQTIRRDQDIQELRRLLQELDRAEQERDLQLQERDLQLQERDRQRQELDEILRTIKSASVWNYFLEGKSLPPLKRRGCATGATPNNKFRRPVKVAIPSVLGILPLGEDVEELTSKRTTNMFSSTELMYATEKSVRDHCKLVLEDMIHAANLKSTLQLRGDLSIAEFHSHDLVISVDDNPVGAVEIKLPVKTRRKHQLINFGHLFDSMMRIRSFHGLKNVFGIVTNFEEWTIAWFPDTDFCATSTLDNPDAYRQTEIAVDTALKRRLHISPTYTRQEAKPLALALYSVLRKMAASAKFFEPVPLLSATRPYVFLKRSSWVWKSGLQLKKLRFQPPNTFALGFYLLRDLDGGADGKVWLACDGAGHLAVIKVLRGIEEGDQAVEVGMVKEEVKRWHQCGLKTVFSCRLADRHAIIMPLAFHYKVEGKTVSIDDRWWKGEASQGGPPVQDFDQFLALARAQSPQEVLASCVNACASVKLVHDDIAWRHVAMFPAFRGFWRTKKSLQHSFIDLSQMANARSQGEALEIMGLKKSELFQKLLSDDTKDYRLSGDTTSK